MRKQLGWILVCMLTVVSALMGVQFLSHSVTVMSEQEPIQRKYRIVIDAGHGLPDGGAISCTGRPESEYNLAIALRLQALMHLLGFETVMVRTEENSVYTQGTTIAQKKVSDLKERVRIVRETDHPILVSIHQNNFPDGRYSGAVVLYAKTEGSEALAKRLQETLISSLNPGSNRSCKKASGIYLMEHIPCTGILIECGFLSNPAEEARLRNDDYQKKLCCVIATSLSNYLAEEKHPTVNVGCFVISSSYRISRSQAS